MLVLDAHMHSNLGACCCIQERNLTTTRPIYNSVHMYIYMYMHMSACVMHTSIVMPILMSHTVCMYGHVYGHAHGQVRGRVHGHGQESRWLTIRLPTAPLLCSARYLCRPVCRNVYIHVCRQVQTCEWMIATVCVAVRGSVHACVCRHVCRDA